MKAVAAVNPNRGVVAIATADTFTIIELLSEWPLELGDVIRWEDDTALGAEVYENVTKHSRATVYVQNHGTSYGHLRKQLLFED